jgi:chromosome segregation ATPase
MSRLANILGVSEERLLAIEARMNRHAERLDAQRDRLQRQGEQLEQQQQRLDRQRQRLRQLARQQADVRTDIATLNVGYPVLLQQMASFETRLQQLVDAADSRPVTATGAEQEQARNLLEEVRREHSQIRARLGVVGRYEERVRRLEAAIAPDHTSAVHGPRPQGSPVE